MKDLRHIKRFNESDENADINIITEQEEILYQYYLKLNTISRNEAIELLKKRDFTSIYRNYFHWINKKEKRVKLKSTKISDVIKELANIKYQDNESEPTLSCWFEEEEGILGSNVESGIEIVSYIYTIVPFERCESSAKHSTKNSLWKLKYQPNGKDAKRVMGILNMKL